MNDLMEDLLRFLTRNPNLGLLMSAFLTSSAVVLVAWAVALQLQRRSARARSVVWRITLAVLLVVAVWRLMPEAAPPVAVVEWRVPLQEPPSIETPILQESPVLVLPQKSIWQSTAKFMDREGIRLWLGAAIVLLCWRVATAAAGMIWLRKHSVPAPEPVLRLLRQLNAPPGLDCRVAQRLRTPMLSGWRRPVIWLVPEAHAWDDTRLRAVLRHELAHLQRTDVAWHWLAQLSVCLWWWQPLAWLAWRSLRTETEHAADDAAVIAEGSTHEYARTLVEIAAGLPSRLRGMPGVTMFGGESVQNRVRELMKASRWRGRIGMGAMSLIALVAVVLAVLAATRVEFKPRTPVYQSEAKLVAGTPADAGPEWQSRLADFYGTIIETVESTEIKRRALERVRALNPDLKDRDVEIHAEQVKGSTMFRVHALSEDKTYARLFLDALLDEFLALRQSILEQRAGKDMHKLMLETKDAQATMEKQFSELEEFRRASSIVSITNLSNTVATLLNTLRTQLQDQQRILQEQEMALHNIPASVTIAQTRTAEKQPMTQTEKDYVQTQSELRRLENELKYLLETHKQDHPLVDEAKAKTDKARYLLKALLDPLRDEMNERAEDTRRKVVVLKEQLAEKEAEALELGSKIAQYSKLERQANVAKAAYEELTRQLQHHPVSGGSADFVAIQERARPATAVMQSGLIPIWKLWKSEPKTSVEDTTPKSAPKAGKPAKSPA
ncbi:M56 family metallopeptidase [Prosthecobacter sp.]|uniref:M56 family metallopeptidase n=1 Tax=Prosthecobacter sp. TaxID=1965333 RepID=UPI003784F5BC